jgi:hypothetical protein
VDNPAQKDKDKRPCLKRDSNPQSRRSSDQTARPLGPTYFVTKKLKLSHYTPRGALGERRYSSYLFLTSALDGGEWSASRPDRALAPGGRTSGTHCTGGWVGPTCFVTTNVIH